MDCQLCWVVDCKTFPFSILKMGRVSWKTPFRHAKGCDLNEERIDLKTTNFLWLCLSWMLRFKERWRHETRPSKQCKSLIWIMILGFLCFNLLQNFSRGTIVVRDIVARDLVARDIDIWWYWVNIGRYWLVFGGTGSVWGSTGWYLVILGQYNLVLFGIKWYWVNKGLLCLYILKKLMVTSTDQPTDQPTDQQGEYRAICLFES